MKRITVLLLCVMMAVVTYGQSKEAESQCKEAYILVTVYSSTTKVEAKIDFGDGTKELYLADENGNKKKLVTFFEPINILIKNGWKIEHYTSLMTGVCQAVMKKKVNEESEIKEGMKLTK